MPIPDIQTYFLQQGLLGIIILVLASVIWWQQRRLDKKDTQIEALNETIHLGIEKRVTDHQQAINGFTSLGKDLVNADSALQKGVDSIVRVLELDKVKQN